MSVADQAEGPVAQIRQQLDVLDRHVLGDDRFDRFVGIFVRPS